MLQIKRLWLRKLQQVPVHLLVVKIASAIAILVGGSVLLGWYLHLEYLKSAGITIATMKANTALCIFLSGVSLWLLSATVNQTSNFIPKQEENPKKIIFWLAQFSALAVTMIGLFTLIQYFFGWNLGIDELLFPDKVIVITTSHPGRMGVNTAINFILIGAALTILNKKNSPGIYWYAQTFALITALISLQALMGYTYKVKVLYGIAPYTTSMALHTVWSFIALSIGILWVDPTQGLMRVVMSDSYAGSISRRLLVVAIIIPFVMGWLITKGEDINLFDSRFAISLFTILIIMMFVVLVWQNATVIEHLNHQRDKAQAALRANQDKVQNFIDNEQKQLTEKILQLNQELQHKQAEMVLQNHRKWLEDVVNLMPIPLLFIEPGTAKVTFANLAADEFFGGKFPLGIPAEEYHTAYHLIDEFGHAISNEQMPGVRVARGESLHELELKWQTSHGLRSVVVFADTLPAMHGYSATGMLVFQDITNLKQTEKALSSGYQKLHLLFNTANSLLSSQQPVELIDSIFQQLSTQMNLDVYFNYLVEDNSQVMRLNSYRGISQELAKEIELLNFNQAICGTVAQERQVIIIENVQLCCDSKTELIRFLGIRSYYGYPLISQGRLLGTLSFASRYYSNFTDNQKGMMQAVCNQIAIAMERASLITSLQQQKEQLSQANRMKDEFLAILSHELRSPLNAILGWTQLLRVRKFSEIQVSKALETIERNAKMQTKLVEDLLDLSRITRGQLQLQTQTCNLIRIIESAMETVNLAVKLKRSISNFLSVKKLKIDSFSPLKC